MISFSDVSFSYDKNFPVLSGLSFEIKKGESVGLIGANGAGKSTLLKCLLGLLPFEGKITVNENEVCEKNLKEIRKTLGFVFQNSDNQLFMPTVIEDMTFGLLNYGIKKEDAAVKAQQVLESLNISELKNRHNHKLSGGEKRMAAIAAVLAMEPQVLLMDEPTSTLDPYNRRLIINTVNSLSQTKIITSHDLDMILDTCSRVILLSDGKMVADGPAEVILKNKELLEAHRMELPFRFQ
ncbi:MAG: energy-coupling factor ABC transporter ATP-binding protein [Treponema sp.]|nr:energy-coupling factor ABC transporter ATP-binding protein [Treponema sp.]